MEQGDSVRVGVGKHDMSRRDFLKTLFTGAGALFLTSCGIAPKESNALQPMFQDVLQGTKLTMNVSGASEPEGITINYFGANDKETPLTVRKNGNELVIKPFVDGEEARRKPGEILENTIYPLQRNPDLPADTTVGMVSSCAYIDNYFEQRSDVDESNLYGIPVIVEYPSQFADTNHIRYETNPDYSERGREAYRASHDTQGIEKFSDGWAVGSKINGVFNVQGFVLIADALRRAS